jgi:hypothetical protein
MRCSLLKIAIISRLCLAKGLLFGVKDILNQKAIYPLLDPDVETTEANSLYNLRALSKSSSSYASIICSLFLLKIFNSKILSLSIL